MERPDYNHSRWPSPRARLVAIKLRLDVLQSYPQIRIKRLTHAQALELLAKKAKKTVPEFLAMPERDSWVALGCVHTFGWAAQSPYDPLYGRTYY